MLTEFQDSLKRLHVSKNDRLLLAVSGGLDSVVLTALCQLAGLDFAIAHANFQLRGAESIRDEIFVRNLAEKYGRPFFGKTFETKQYAENEKCSIQVAARDLRYEWFHTLSREENFPFVVTAHQLDDHIETMVIHFFRGTGIQGLTGIPERNGRLLRPLLSFSREQFKVFAVDKQLEWVEDSSNASSDYTRNYFRNELFPSLTPIFPDLSLNLKNNLRRFSEVSMLYNQAVSQHKKKLLKPSGTEMHIPILLLRKSVPTASILHEILKDYHFTPAQTGEVIRLMESANGRYISSATHRIIKNRSWLIIAPLEDKMVAHVIIDQHTAVAAYTDGTIHLKISEKHDPAANDKSVACLDMEKIQFPLILRKWKAGDYFYPLGMTKKKKLARFFIDQKLSKTAKEKVWVVIMDKQIIWVVGQRIDNRFCVHDSTKRMLVIRNEDVSVHS